MSPSKPAALNFWQDLQDRFGKGEQTSDEPQRSGNADGGSAEPPSATPSSADDGESPFRLVNSEYTQNFLSVKNNQGLVVMHGNSVEIK